MRWLRGAGGPARPALARHQVPGHRAGGQRRSVRPLWRARCARCLHDEAWHVALCIPVLNVYLKPAAEPSGRVRFSGHKGQHCPAIPIEDRACPVRRTIPTLCTLRTIRFGRTNLCRPTLFGPRSIASLSRPRMRRCANRIRNRRCATVSATRGSIARRSAPLDGAAAPTTMRTRGAAGIAGAADRAAIRRPPRPRARLTRAHRSARAAARAHGRPRLRHRRRARRRLWRP